MSLLVTLLGCYVLGGVPTAYWLVKWTKRVDLRTVGSGNVGATNALRTAGPWAGLIVLVIDILKGVFAALFIPRWVFGGASSELSLACGVAAVLGHDFSCFLGFQGGKGVATTLGVLLGTSPLVVSVVGGVWAAVFVVSRYVSLGSVSAAVAIPFSQVAFHRPVHDVWLGGCLAGLILVRHRDNLKRLLSGVEHRAWARQAD